MGDGEKTGLRTGLGVNRQFANAALHGLSRHKKARLRSSGDGIDLPINEDTWQRVFEKEFPYKKRTTAGRMQSLKTQCGYYNNGAHGLGYDKNGKFDLGHGDRDKEKQNRGRSIKDTAFAIHPGNRSHVTPEEVIEIAWNIWLERGKGGVELNLADPFSDDSFQDHHFPAQRQLSEEAQALDDEGYFERKRVMREIAQRYGQPQFRARLLDAYQFRCAISGSCCQWTLEAAHINPYAEEGDDNVANGLLLRADIHTLFDLNLIGIDPQLRKIVIADCLKNSEYKEFEDRPLLLPKDSSQIPEQGALDKRWRRFLDIA